MLIFFWLFVIHVLSKFPDAGSVNVSKQQFRCQAHTRTTKAHPLQRRKNGWSSVRGEWTPCCATYGRPSEGMGVLAILRQPKIEKFKSMYTPKNLFAERLRGALYTYCPRVRREHTQSKYSHSVAVASDHVCWKNRYVCYRRSRKSTRILKSARFLLLSERTFHLTSSSNCFIAERVFR